MTLKKKMQCNYDYLTKTLYDAIESYRWKNVFFLNFVFVSGKMK